MSAEMNLGVVTFLWFIWTCLVALVVWILAFNRAENKFYAEKCRDCKFPFMSQKFYEASCKWDEFKMEFISTWVDWFPTVPMSDMYQALRHVSNELERLRKDAKFECTCQIVTGYDLHDKDHMVLHVAKDCKQHKFLLEE